MDEIDPIAEREEEPRGDSAGMGKEASLEMLNSRILDGFPVGLLLLDLSGRELARNAAAARVLASKPFLSIREATLRFSEETMQESFERWLEALPQATGRARAWSAHIRAGRVRAFTAAARSTEQGILMSLRAGPLDRELCPVQLRAVFNLTSAESRLAQSLANGLSVEDTAHATGASVHTLRSQLKAIFRKTEVTRQAELVAVLLSDPLLSKI